MKFSPAKLIGLALLVPLLSLAVPLGYFILKEDVNSNIPVKQVANQHIASFVINLDRSKERYDYVLPSLKKLGYPIIRISGIDGKKLSEEVIQESVDFDSYHKYLNHHPRLGMIGCNLSHIKAWRTLLESNYQYAIVFEDDVSFEPNSVRKVVDELVANDLIWDITSLEIAHSGMPMTVRNLADNKRLVVYLTEVTHAGAYVISRAGAAKLLKKAMPLKLPIDHYFTRAWEMDLIFTGVEPRLVTQSFGDSEINKTDRAKDDEPKSIYRALYLAQSNFIRFFYNLKLYFSL